MLMTTFISVKDYFFQTKQIFKYKYQKG